MSLKFFGLIVCFSFLLTQNENSQKLQLLSKPCRVPGVHRVILKPPTSGFFPAVILLYGIKGWWSEYFSVAKNLADSGFVALALDYYATKEKVSLQEHDESEWSYGETKLRNVVTFLQEDPSVKKRSVGLVGYSQGVFLAISIAATIPEVKTVVDYCGGGSSKKDELEADVRSIPPLFILHGEDEIVVPFSLAYSLREAVLAQGGVLEFKIYPKQPHGFNEI